MLHHLFDSLGSPALSPGQLVLLRALAAAVVAFVLAVIFGAWFIRFQLEHRVLEHGPPLDILDRIVADARVGRLEPVRVHVGVGRRVLRHLDGEPLPVAAALDAQAGPRVCACAACRPVDNRKPQPYGIECPGRGSRYRSQREHWRATVDRCP